MREKIDLVLVNPGSHKQVYGKLASTLKGIEPPLWCALIAAYVREQGYSVKIIDAEVEKWSPEFTAEKIIEYNPFLTGVIAIGSNPSVPFEHILKEEKEEYDNQRSLVYEKRQSC